MYELADIREGWVFAFTLLNGERILCSVKADEGGYYIAHDNRPPTFLFDLADIDAPVFQQRVLGYSAPVCSVRAFPRCKTLDDLRILLHHLLRQLPHRGMMKHEEEACKASTDPVIKIFPMKPVILSKNKNELSLLLITN
jgi:hypothetical protein